MWNEAWSDIRHRIRMLVGRRAADHELDAEIADHLGREAAALERTGLPPDQARRQARLAFGGIEAIREETREAWGTALAESVVSDLRYALRVCAARPAFTLGVVLTLALGIGANAAMLGIVDRLLFQAPAFLEDVDLVHRVYQAQTSRGTERIRDYTTIGRLLDIQRGTSSFSAVVPIATQRRAVGFGAATREAPVTGAGAAFFDLFGVQPMAGRLFDAADDRLPQGTPVAVLGYAYWTTAFGARPDVVGETVQIGGTAFTIIGVAPKDFVGFEETAPPAAFVPFAAFVWDARPEDHASDYHWHFLRIIVKRRADVSVDAATADLSAAIDHSWRAEGRSDVDRIAAAPRAVLGPVQSERGPLARPEARVALWVGGVAVIVLVIACANVANLLLARTLTRRREIAMRLALGASPARLSRQLFIEGAVLAAAAAVGSLLVANGLSALVRVRFFAADVPAPSLLNGRTAAMTLATTLAVAIAVSLAPIIQARRARVGQVPAGGARATDPRAARLRTGLLIVQVSLSVLLLIVAGLFVRSLQQARGVPLGYDVDPIVVVNEHRRGDQRPPDAAWIEVERRLAEAAAGLPGVVAATPVTSVPFWGFEGHPVSTDDASVKDVEALGTFYLQAGTTDYFRTTGTRVLRGRGIEAADTSGSPPVVVVGSAMAQALWPGQDAIGRCLYIHLGPEPPACRTVVGLAEDVRAESLAGRAEFMYYLPLSQFPVATGMMLVRVAGRGADFAESVRRGLQPALPADAYVTVTPFEDMLAPAMRGWRLGATMFGAFGVLALIVAAVGLYSGVAYAVAQRRRELAVRVALGATRADLLRLVLRGGLGPVALSIILGSAVSAIAARGVASLLFRVSPAEPAVHAAVAAVMLLVATAALYLPARAAALTDPNDALRIE